MAIMHTYPEICQNTIRRIEEGRETTCINTYYKHSSGFIWCINSKGYYHIYKPEKINTNIGIFSGMVHYRLKDDNTLTEVDYKILDTKEKFIDFYNSFNAE